MTYGIYFDGATSAEALRQALHTVYGVPVELVYVGPEEQLDDHPGPGPIALITPSGGPFGYEFSAGAKLRDLTHATELELAVTLCRMARTRALVDDGSDAPDRWLLVSADGSHGPVLTDPDSDDLTIRYALEPLAAEPDLPVRRPPDGGWAGQAG